MGRTLMDCQEVKELLDAYALGAAERVEAEALERHAADCVRCWDELNEVQRTAALLSLSVRMEKAPARLRERILAQAERERRRGRSFSSLRRALEGRWPAVAGAVAAAGIAALAFAAVLQLQINDLRDENSRLDREVEGSGLLLDEQRQMMAVLSAPDVQELPVPAISSESEAVGVYYWSKLTGKGFLVCNNLPKIKEGQVYQAWFVTGGEAVSAGTFEYWNGTGQMAMDLSTLDQRPEAIAVSIETAGGSDRPAGEMLLFASMPSE